MDRRKSFARSVRIGLLAVGLSLSMGMAVAPESVAGYSEFENLAIRSESVLVGAGLADQSGAGGWCSAFICWYDAECGQDCVCLPFNWQWGFCWSF